jgi:Sec-independent protein translocase protein TatA
MSYMGFQNIAILFIVVLLILGKRRLTQLGHHGDDLSQLARELKRHMPVYSAETIEGREAEFIRDRLRKRIPPWLVPLIVLTVSALAWWFTR